MAGPGVYDGRDTYCVKIEEDAAGKLQGVGATSLGWVLGVSSEEWVGWSFDDLTIAFNTYPRRQEQRRKIDRQD